MAHQSQVGWVIFLLFGSASYGLSSLLVLLSIICLIRVIILSSRRKKHVLNDYITVIVGLALAVFSPAVISGALSFFRITWNEDGGVSVTLKSKDPYYLSGDSTSDGICRGNSGTSNDLKDIDVDSHYSYYDDVEKRKTAATRHYVSRIGEEVLCQVGEYYMLNGHYPDENDIKKFSSSAINNDVRSGVFNIKPEVGAEPNDKDFTILFDRNCSNQRTIEGNVVVLTPLYGDEGRYCVYNEIDDITPHFGGAEDDE